MTTSPSPKHAGGRPSLYKGEETIQKVADFIDEMKADLDTFRKHAIREQLALRLGVCRETIDKWEEVHEEFADIIKKWVETRNAHFMELYGKIAPVLWIFMSKQKTWLELRDAQVTEHSGELRVKVERVVSKDKLEE